MASSDTSPTTRRLFVTDRNSRISFLIDTGADLCVYPRTAVRGPLKKSSYELAAANGSILATYGTEILSLELGLRRVFPWKFVIADVSKPIIGSDFPAHCGLLVVLQNSRLIDQLTKISTQGNINECSQPGMKVIVGASPYHHLLGKFSEITRPDGRTP